MRIIMTDTCRIWNYIDPIFEQFKDILLIVCLNGKAVTDKYECFVSPYQQVGRGMVPDGLDSHKLKALASVAGNLNRKLHYHDDIVFISDNEPSSLYAYYVLKGVIEYNRIHLVTMSPWQFESDRRLAAYRELLSDLSELSSFFYYDSESVVAALRDNLNRPNIYDYARNYLNSILPTVLNGIHNMRKYPSYFDFSSMSYVPLKNGFQAIDVRKKPTLDEEICFEPYRSLCTLGMILPPEYPDSKKATKEEVERQPARINGKQVCELLRKQRIFLAQVNNIPFESEECPSEGPCAGTCEKCDSEAKYLAEKLNEIPEEKRVYPLFDSETEMGGQQEASVLPEEKPGDILMGDIFSILYNQ